MQILVNIVLGTIAFITIALFFLNFVFLFFEPPEGESWEWFKKEFNNFIEGE